MKTGINVIGKLVVACSHIGNPKDITINTLEHISNATNVIVENEQRFFALCNDAKISLKDGVDIMQIKYYDETGAVVDFESKAINNILHKLKSGEDVLMLSDEGSPGISDPGLSIVNACIDNDIEVIYLPGANSVLPSFLLAGFNSHRFVYLGFLFAENRKDVLSNFKDGIETIILHSSPSLAIEILNDISDIFGIKKKIAVSVSLTKDNQVFRGTVEQMIDYAKQGKFNAPHTIAIKGIL